MNWREQIVVDPAVLVGKPIIKGTRISVELLLDRFADGWGYDEVLAAYPHLTRSRCRRQRLLHRSFSRRKNTSRSARLRRDSNTARQ